MVAGEDIIKRDIIRIVRDHQVMVFSKSTCPNCKMTKDLLEKKGIKAKYLELD